MIYDYFPHFKMWSLCDKLCSCHHVLRCCRRFETPGILCLYLKHRCKITSFVRLYNKTTYELLVWHSEWKIIYWRSRRSSWIVIIMLEKWQNVHFCLLLNIKNLISIAVSMMRKYKHVSIFLLPFVVAIENCGYLQGYGQDMSDRNNPDFIGVYEYRNRGQPFV